VKLFNVAAKTGCNYFCINVKITICNDCEKIDKRTLTACPDCGSNDIDHGTRVIGYLKRVTAFSQARQKEHALRHYHKESA
jgi:ribonucleoside-triphosphate reductase